MWNTVKPEAEVIAPDSASLWGNVFGLGGLFRVLNDPQLAQHAHGMMQAIIESAQATQRLEQKLDKLREEIAALLASGQTAGTGRRAVATDVIDLGSGQPSGTSGPAGGTAVNGGQAIPRTINGAGVP